MVTFRRAFTLIELLVVVAIIALLMAMLVPAVENARRQAKVVICSTQLRGYALGLIMYATQDPSGNFPPHDEAGWGSLWKVWSSVSPVYRENFPDRRKALYMYRDTICGGRFNILWCPLYPDGFYNPMLPGYPYPKWADRDREFPELWYDSRFGQNYMGSYIRFANAVGVDYTYSGNSQTDGPPVKPGRAQDAIVADTTEAEPGYLFGNHMDGYYTMGDARLGSQRETNVAYGDGHVETHYHRNAYIDFADYMSWEGAHYVLRGGIVREMY